MPMLGKLRLSVFPCIVVSYQSLELTEVAFLKRTRSLKGQCLYLTSTGLTARLHDRISSLAEHSHSLDHTVP
jgi:hypothetical protein